MTQDSDSERGAPTPDPEADLPRFRYHPRPLATGSVEASDEPCDCCGRVRGYLYREPLLADLETPPSVCPWCIADGRARTRLGVELFEPDAVGGHGLWDKVAPEVVDEVAYRTPGFSGWTEERWWTHCGDAAEFHGPAGRAEVERWGPAMTAALRAQSGVSEADWPSLLARLDRDAGPTAYLFRCRHCGAPGGYIDFPP